MAARKIGMNFAVAMLALFLGGAMFLADGPKASTPWQLHWRNCDGDLEEMKVME